MTRRPEIADEQYERLKREYPWSKSCPTCKGAGTYRFHGEEYQCNCEEQLRFQTLYYNANVGRQFHTLGWDDFQSQDRAELVPEFQDYAKNFEAKYRYGRGYVLSGPLGTGKTLLLSCVLKDVAKAGYDPYFIQLRQLVHVMASSYRDLSEKRVIEDRMKQCDLLGLDELTSGISQRQHELVEDVLEEIIRHRYNHSLPTWVTTNLTVYEQNEKFTRVFSLLTAKNKWRETSGGDYRKINTTLRDEELEANGEVHPLV